MNQSSRKSESDKEIVRPRQTESDTDLTLLMHQSNAGGVLSDHSERQSQSQIGVGAAAWT
jgi:hypothetical protein